MSQYLRLTAFILLTCSLLCNSHTARASHLLGGDLTYTALGGNNYQVKFRLYRDCTGITPGSFVLECRSGGCNTVPTVTATLVQQGAVVSGNPFCAAVASGPCQGPAGLPNYDVYSFQATVTLPPGTWTLSTSQNARPTLANIVSGDLYVQATLDNRNTAAGAPVLNSSPQFDPLDIPIQYVCWKQPTTVSYSAIEPDGDSLVYALAAPLESCNTPVTYSANSSLPSGGVVVLSTNPLCVLQLPSSAGNFTPTLPIPVALDTTGSCPIKTAAPRFNFNQRARTISFTPSVYYANTASNLGRNKYQIAMQLTEYRRINGAMRVIGRVQREGTLIVTDCGTNTVPNPVVTTAQTPNSGTQAINTADTTQIDVFACSYSRVRLNFTDPDNLRVPSARQLLSVTLPTDINTNPNLLDSGDIGSFALAGNNSENPVGTFFFQPSPATVGRIIRLNIRVEDNACPIKGIQNRVVIIRIRRGNFAAALATAGGGSAPAICAGTSIGLRGSAFRPDSVRNLSANATRLQTYSYQWTLVSGNGLDPATAAQAGITVSPTATSRYRLRITPNSGFGPGCGDTTSIVVRVLAPVPTPTVTRTGGTLTSSAATGNQWYRDGQLIAGATGQSYTPTSNGTYTVRATAVVGTTSCSSAPSLPLTVLATQRILPGSSLSVVPNPTPTGRFSVVLTGYHQPVTITVFDALGRTVGRAFIAAPAPQGTTQPLDLASLGAGLYVLQVRTATSLETRRIVRE